MFCVVVINAFCCHSGGYCLLPPALLPPKKNRRVWGFAWGGSGQGGASPAESDICLESSHFKTGGLHMPGFLNERFEHLCEELQRRLRRAKFSSPKPPRASGKTSEFMKLQRAGQRGCSSLASHASGQSGSLQGSHGLLCSSWLLLLALFSFHTKLVKTILQSNRFLSLAVA